MIGKKTSKIPVLYIAGPSRSGSTILAQILGEIPGFFNAGELMNIWDRGIKDQGTCSCGNSVNDCSIWRTVTEEIYQYTSFNHIDILIKLRDKLAHSKKVLLNFHKQPADFIKNNDSKIYLDILSCLYRSIVKTTHCQVIIDSSKNLGYAYYLAKTRSLELYLVHLIRDSRAAAYSWMHKKGDLYKLTPFSSSKTWNSRNLIGEIIGRQMKGKYIRILYEKFIQEPQKTVKNIILMLKANPKLCEVPFISNNEVRLNKGHIIYGNPDRFKCGIIRLKNDDKWIDDMRLLDKLTVTALTWPFLFRYDYPIIFRK